MRTSRPSPLVGAVSALVAAATTWIAVLAWRGFTEDAHLFLVPLAVLAVLVAGLGAVLRWWRTPAALVVLTQVVVGGLVGAWFISGALLPVGAGYDALRQAFVDAKTSANLFAPPVPAEAPGVHPFLIAGGLGCLLLVDILVCTLRRAPLAGLPLLTIYSVPVGMLGITLTWWVFAITAVGYLALLYLEQGERVRRWGRSLDGDAARRTSGGGTPSAVRVHATAIGGGVTVMAVLLPLLIPTLSVQLLDFGRGPGGNDQVKVVNPTTDLRRDLVQPRDVPLIRFTTDNPSPAYLRIANLVRFSDNAFSPGDRDIPSGQVASGALPPLSGVSPTVTRTSYDYRYEATDSFDSKWLPTEEATTDIQALGDWRYDTATMDFIASDDDLTTQGLSWSLTADSLGFDRAALDQATSSKGQVSPAFLDLPSGISPFVRNLANEVTTDAPNQFEKAVALQNWFRDSGGFTYSTDVDLGTGTDDLVRFLSSNDGGRTGYCEQFASAMTVMARMLGIPARVAVGFLQPEKVGPDTWEYSTHDLHAWPELYIPGGGWMRFEPTPPTRASGVPDYTTQGVTPTNPDIPGASDGANPDEELPRDAATAAPDTPDRSLDTPSATTESGTTWWPYLLVLMGLALLTAAALAPGVVRRRRRERRRDGGVEQAWAELRDTAVDLGLGWPERRSPRETAAALRSAIGVTDLPALDRMVTRLEQLRYAAAPTPGSEAGLRTDLDAVLGAMRDRASSGTQRRAAWLPRSVFRRDSGRDRLPLSDDQGNDRLLERV